MATTEKLAEAAGEERFIGIVNKELSVPDKGNRPL
jgi:hypothetical protein